MNEDSSTYLLIVCAQGNILTKNYSKIPPSVKTSLIGCLFSEAKAVSSIMCSENINMFTIFPKTNSDPQKLSIFKLGNKKARIRAKKPLCFKCLF